MPEGVNEDSSRRQWSRPSVSGPLGDALHANPKAVSRLQAGKAYRTTALVLMIMIKQCNRYLQIAAVAARVKSHLWPCHCEAARSPQSNIL